MKPDTAWTGAPTLGPLFSSKKESEDAAKFQIINVSRLGVEKASNLPKGKRSSVRPFVNKSFRSLAAFTCIFEGISSE